MRRQTDRQTGRSNLRLTRKRAFTLVELLVVIVVIGILFAVLISRVDFAGDKAKTTGAMTDLRSYQLALQTIATKEGLITSDVNMLARTLNSNLDSALAVSVVDEKIVSDRTDPWGTPYNIEIFEDRAYLYSAGKDSKFKTNNDVIAFVRVDKSNGLPNVVLGSCSDTSKYEYNLETASWSDIAMASEDGFAAMIYNIGDVKIVNDCWTVQIAGFDHDNLSDGSGKAGITFTTCETSDYEYWMNQSTGGYSSGRNLGGWAETEMRSLLNGTYYDTLPSDLKSVIKSVDKISDNGCELNAASTTLITTSDQLWLLSAEEVGLCRDYTVYTRRGQGAVYPLYSSNQDRLIDCFINDNHYNGEYWLRSSRDTYHFNFYTVGETGKAGSAVAESYKVVAPGFCI